MSVILRSPWLTVSNYGPSPWQRVCGFFSGKRNQFLVQYPINRHRLIGKIYVPKTSDSEGLPAVS
jgi:hypothetical protein